jgi:hypothetical protein
LVGILLILTPRSKKKPMTSTNPLPAYVPRDDAAALTEEEREALREVVEATGHDVPMQLVPFLRDVEWDEESATERFRHYVETVGRLPPVRLAQVLDFIGNDSEGVPLPCGVLLEDGRGQIARDRRGNPVVLVYGTFECDGEAAKRQLLHINQRIQKYASQAPQQALHVTYVFDMGPRAGKHSLSRQLDLDFLRFTSVFPQSYSLYVVSAPKGVVQTLSLVPPSMRSRLTLCSDYSALAGVLDSTNMLPRWGGSFDFDLDRYRAFLVADEGDP